MIGLPNHSSLNTVSCHICNAASCISSVAAAKLKPGQIVCVRRDGLVPPYFGIVLDWPSVGVKHYFTSIMIEASSSGYSSHACVDVNAVTVLPMTLDEAMKFNLISSDMVHTADELGLMQLEHPPEWASMHNRPQGPRWTE